MNIKRLEVRDRRLINPMAAILLKNKKARKMD